MGSEQQYVDLLYRATKKFASWDPEVPVEVGDWGRFTTGRPRWAFWRAKRCLFVKEGNIYKDKIAEKYEIPEPRVIGEDSSDGLTWFTSPNVRDIDAESQTPLLPECDLKAGFQFSSDGGAVLVMAHDSLTTIDPASSLRRLLEVDTLRDRVLVSETHHCASYARYLASPRTGNVVIGLTAQPPPGAPSAQAEFKWVHSAIKGDFKSKADGTGERRCCPLYKIVSLKGAGQGGRRGSVDDEMPLPLPDAVPPWMAGNVPIGGSDDKKVSEFSKR
ncbi:hypothetical protein HYDPIDRAFT_182752 [Hydnomerulius pinastri MD-312]|uniref:Uncharacterized protein n=1 Tax=Hydnomerulius pinastri MD-312 TaxID=994086 RepID=A0A0C9WDT7_9AGAM|nr:hypothetical protein HYDPIDRAFT_182752 [Hydnomerulius pinastri MD-312]